MTMHTPPHLSPNRQSGVALLEGLIALMIFSIGIISLMGLQAVAINNSRDAKLRADASFLSNQIIGHMWSERANVGLYAYNNTAGSCSGYATVCSWLVNVVGALPGASGQVQQIQVTNIAAGVNEVAVTLRWRSPQDTTTHSFVTTTRIGG